jgi:uncharacterized membrane protein
MSNTVFSSEEKSVRLVTHIVYLLQALGFFCGITFIAGIIVNYIKLDDVRGTWLESHFRWQMRTFWFGLLWSVIGGITLFVFIGAIILFVNVVWIIYRITKGWLRLFEGKEIV